MRRFAMLALSLSMTLGLAGAFRLAAQEPEKAKEVAKTEVVKTTVEPTKTTVGETTKTAEPAKTEPAKTEMLKTAEPAKDEMPTAIPPEVEAKLNAARRAVAELIVAAQDAGLVKSSIDPPPILDILITGRANDEATLKARTGVSTEVFGAWFTGFGKTEGIVPQTDVRIMQPSQGLKTWYEQRANILRTEIEAVRKAKGTPAPKDEVKKDEPKKDEVKKDEPPKEELKKEEPKKDEPPKEGLKKDEVKKEEPPKQEVKKEEPKG